MHGSEVWCLEESEVGIFRRTDRSMANAICGVQLRDRKRSSDLMFMLGLSEAMDQLAVANSVCWYGHVLWREERELKLSFNSQPVNGAIYKHIVFSRLFRKISEDK